MALTAIAVKVQALPTITKQKPTGKQKRLTIVTMQDYWSIYKMWNGLLTRLRIRFLLINLYLAEQRDDITTILRLDEGIYKLYKKLYQLELFPSHTEKESQG